MRISGQKILWVMLLKTAEPIINIFYSYSQTHLVAHTASSRAPCGRGDPLKQLANRLPRRQKMAPRNDKPLFKAISHAIDRYNFSNPSFIKSILSGKASLKKLCTNRFCDSRKFSPRLCK